MVSYTTSPAAEVYYSEGKYKEPPTGNLFPELAFFQVEFVGILKGTKNLEAARRFVDWLLSRPVQENIPTEMWVYPARRDARLPEVFRFTPPPAGAVRLDPARMAANRERWIEEWTRVVLQGQDPEAVRAGRR